MRKQTVKPYPKWLCQLDTVDSTNNYAIKLIEDGMAQHGTVVWALEQTAGKGQRGRKWETEPGQNIMMSLVIEPHKALASNPYHLNMLIPYVMADYFARRYQYWQVQIKWPNDIYINAKKSAGILIENIFRGSQWSYAIVGIGINVNQTAFPEHLSTATSLQKESGLAFDLLDIIQDLRAGILNLLMQYGQQPFEHFVQAYNCILLGRGQRMRFRLRDDDEIFEATVLEVDAEGLLHLQTAHGLFKCASGSLQWLF